MSNQLEMPAMCIIQECIHTYNTLSEIKGCMTRNICSNYPPSQDMAICLQVGVLVGIYSDIVGGHCVLKQLSTLIN